MSPENKNAERQGLSPEQEIIAYLKGQLAEKEATIAAQDEKIKELEKERDEAVDLSLKDPGTKLLNRRGLEETTRLLLSQRRETGEGGKETERRPVAVLVLDIDDFKAVNDVYEHPEGDRILVETAKFLEDRVRPGDIVARIGGEEFAIIFYNASEQDIFNAFYDKGTGKSRVGFNTELGGVKDHRVTMSGGITMFKPEEDAKDLAAALARADTALYASKNSPGKDRLTIFTDALKKEPAA